jgi:hypothetical protein
MWIVVSDEMWHFLAHNVRAALHLEAGPIRCVRGLKSSLVIGQKAEISPNPDLVAWFFSN